jgi:molybdopterin adenylyltransferase
MNPILVGVITISDRASAGEYDDLGGPAVKEAVTRYGWQVRAEAIVPDDIVRIQEAIRSFFFFFCCIILYKLCTGVS